MSYFWLFVAGALLCNGLPHLLAGLQGVPFPTPFARQPGRSDSPPLVNAVWAAANLVVGLFLLAGHPFRFAPSAELAVFAAGFVLAALGLAWHFGRVRSPGSSGR